MAKHRTGHLFRRGKNFYVRWAVEGKVFSKALRDGNGNAITTRREAEDERSKVMAPFLVADEAAALESIAGKLAGRKAELAKIEDELNPALPISQAWTAFLASPNRPDSGELTLAGYQVQFSMFAQWMAEKYPGLTTMRDVTRNVAEEYAGRLKQGRSANTFNKHLNLLSLVFRVLKKKAKLTENPWDDIQRKRLITHSRRELTIEELRKVCQGAPGELRTLFAIGIYSGLRLGDCATLRWGEVDLARAMIRRIPNKTARRHPRPVIVPIHPTLLAMFAEIAADGRGEYVMPETAKTYLGGTKALIKDIQQHFGACGIKVHKNGTGPESKDGDRAVVEVGFHSLRHTFVSLCRESNAPLAVVESIVGHSNPSMTRHYTHVGELAAGIAVAALPSVMGEAKQEPKRSDHGAILREARAIAKSLTGKNWRQKKAAILALLINAAEDGQTAPEARS